MPSCTHSWIGSISVIIGRDVQTVSFRASLKFFTFTLWNNTTNRSELVEIGKMTTCEALRHIGQTTLLALHSYLFVLRSCSIGIALPATNLQYSLLMFILYVILHYLYFSLSLKYFTNVQPYIMFVKVRWLWTDVACVHVVLQIIFLRQYVFVPVFWQ